MTPEEELGSQVSQTPVHLIQIDSLSVEDSPRLEGENPEHTRLLLASESVLPPILVHRPTLRVIDGIHRLNVARLRGQSSISVRFFDGSEADAFVLAVQSNVRHGMPLSLADRTAAAERIARSRPEWSDRAVARVSGLSPKTVAAIRRRSSGEIPLSNTRLGQDGRTRPVSSAEGRQRAGRLIADHPSMPLRQVAKEAGISIGTAHDVRERVRSGRDPLPERARRALDTPPETATAPDDLPTLAPRSETVRPLKAQDTGRASGTLLHILCKDPSLRFTETGRALLRLFDAQAQVVQKWDRLVDGVPQHCAEMIIDLADNYSRYWQEFAVQLRTGAIAHHSDRRISS